MDQKNHKAAETNVNAIRFVVACIGRFAREKKLTLKEACGYLIRFGAIDFIRDHYEVQHQLSLSDSVDDMTAICLRNGGEIG